MHKYKWPHEMRMSGSAMTELMKFEGLRLTVYKDDGGYNTVGYGHRTVLHTGVKIKTDKAIALLRRDITLAQICLSHTVHEQLTQPEFDALIDFIFNIGCKHFKDSRLLQRLNDGDFRGAADEFEKWIYADGRELPGLVKRRKWERDLFLSSERFQA